LDLPPIAKVRFVGNEMATYFVNVADTALVAYLSEAGNSLAERKDRSCPAFDNHEGPDSTQTGLWRQTA
jgi:hypothetical protein